MRTVYHKGELTKPNKPYLSTGVDRASVDGLKRPGMTHQYDIPEDVYFKWELDDRIRTFTDLDLETGIINNELRFDRSIVPKLMEYER